MDLEENLLIKEDLKAFNKVLDKIIFDDIFQSAKTNEIPKKRASSHTPTQSFTENNKQNNKEKLKKSIIKSKIQLQQMLQQNQQNTQQTYITQENQQNNAIQSIDQDDIYQDEDNQDNLLLENEEFTNKIDEYREYPYRWVNSFVFMLIALSQAISVHTFTPIGVYIQKIYKYDSFEVTLPALIFMFVSPTIIVVNYYTDKHGLKKSTTFGCILLSIGAVLKINAQYSYTLLLISQILSGIGHNFIANCSTKVASNWFKPKNRAQISILFALSITISPSIGIMLPSLFVDQNSDRDDVFWLIFTESMIIAVSSVLNIIFFKEKPPQPPSYTAVQERKPFVPQLKQLFTNKDYYFLLFAMGFSLGGLASFVSVIAFYIKPYGYQPHDISIAVVLCTTSGIISSSVVGFYVKKYKKLKKTIVIGLLGLSLMFLAFQVFLEISEPIPAVITVIFSLLGIFTYPAISTILELGAEIAYPVSEANIAGFLYTIDSIIGFFMGVLGSSIVKGDSTSQSVSGYFVFQTQFLLALFSILLLKEDFKRTKGEIKASLPNLDSKRMLTLGEEELNQIKQELSKKGII